MKRDRSHERSERPAEGKERKKAKDRSRSPGKDASKSKGRPWIDDKRSSGSRYVPGSYKEDGA